MLRHIRIFFGLLLFVAGGLAGADLASARTVVVFAPHPDDEALMSSGVIHKAKLNGDVIKVVLATNGDCKLAFSPHTRELETMAAMRDVLGLANDDVIFLGYPDCGLRDMYTYFTSPSSVYTSVAGRTETYAFEGLGGTDYHSYRYGAPAPYNKPSMINDVKLLLSTLRPDEVFVTSGYDAHSDHYALYYFVVEAMVSVTREDPSFRAALYEGFVHEPCEACDPSYHWPDPPFLPDQYLPEPPYLYTTPLEWSRVQSLEVPLAMQDPNSSTNLKYQALSQYQTQLDPWFFAFVKKDEVFWKTEFFNNVALRATASASSELVMVNALASKVNDGFVMGEPIKYDGEWSSVGQSSGAWVQLDWAQGQAINRVMLHDRPNLTDRVLGGTLTFSDGSSIPVGPLPNNGAGLSVDFPTKVVTWLRFTANSVAGEAGLAELEVFLISDPTNTPPVLAAGPTSTPTRITSLETSSVTVSASDMDGDSLTYYWSATGGTVSGAGFSVEYTPPMVSATTDYRVDVVVVDGRGGAVTGSVTITVDPRPNTAPTLTTGPTPSPGAITDVETSSVSVTASDADGDTLSYAWSATGGTVSGSGSSVTYTPPRVTTTAVFQVSVVVTDGWGGSTTGSADISVTPSGLPINIARSATATASSQRTSSGQGAAKAIDGVISGYPLNSSAEWVTQSQGAGAWITLTWNAPQTAARVVLYDRINTTDRIMAATLQFSDGTSLPVGALPNDGAPYGMSFTPKTVTWVTLHITATAGPNVGLAEFEVFDIAGGANAVPVLTAGPSATPETIASEQTSALNVTASDPDGDALGYTWSTTGGAVSGTGPEAVFTAPAVSVTTPYEVNVVVSDGRGGSVSGSVTVTVTPPNTAPVLTAGPTTSPATITDVETSGVSVTASDADGDTLSYAWSATGGAISGSGANATYTPPRVSAITVFQLSVVVTDGRGGTVTGAADVTVTPSGAPINIARSAIATSSSQRTPSGQGAAKSIDGVISGYPVNSSAEWVTELQGAGAWIRLTWGAPQTVARVVLYDRINTTDRIMAGTLQFSDGTSLPVGALPNEGGPYGINFAAKSVTWITLQIAATTGTNVGLAEFEVFDTVGTGVNSAPQITSGPTANPSTVGQGQTSALNVAASDPDGDVLSYVWSASGGSVSGSGATATYSPPSVPESTVYQISVTVSDGRGGNVTGVVNITVVPPNRAPEISAGPAATPASISDLETSSLSVTATDADGDPLSFSWSATGGTVTGSGMNATFTPPRVTGVAVYQIVVTVTDGRGGTATGATEITVTPSGEPINVALTAAATASTQNASRGQGAAKAIDGVVSGYPVDSTREWATIRELAGAWIMLTWSSPQTISRVVLHDRINTTDQILGGILRFSDGSTVAVGTLPNDGSGYVVDFPAKTVTSVRLEITSARGGNIGLAEFEVY